MRVTKMIELRQEVDVSVSVEEIISAMVEHPESTRQALIGINNFHGFMRAVTPEMIKEMTPSQRALVGAWFYEQAQRFDL